MREIKFRGLNLKWRTWAYGYYCCIADKHYIIERDVELADVDSPCPEHGINGFAEVDPETVGEFTGLKDKNGREIWEDDVIKVQFGEQEMTYTCAWYGEVGAWVFRGNGEWLMYEDVFETSEVIGNLHENPEVLHGIDPAHEQAKSAAESRVENPK